MTKSDELERKICIGIKIDETLDFKYIISTYLVRFAVY